MTKSIIADRKKSDNEHKIYDNQVRKFLDEFSIKDSKLISQTNHEKLMLSHFYWVDKETNQGYHIPDDIEDKRRLLNKVELCVYENLYYDATTH